jgi:hypothetical protein
MRTIFSRYCKLHTWLSRGRILGPREAPYPGVPENGLAAVV